MFNDALKSKKISHDQTPWFPMPKDSEVAGSYIYPEDFAKILAALPTKQSIDAKNAKVKRSGRSAQRDHPAGTCTRVSRSASVLLLPIRHGLPRRCG
jgi:hypothetical protein